MSGLSKVLRGLAGVVVVGALIFVVNHYYGEFKSASRTSAASTETSLTAGADATAVVAVQGQSVVILADGVILRAKPDATAKAVRTLKKGATLALVGVTASNWLQLRDTKGVIGFTLNDKRYVAVKR